MTKHVVRIDCVRLLGDKCRSHLYRTNGQNMLRQCAVMILAGFFVVCISAECDQERFDELSRIPVKSMTEQQYQEYSRLRDICLDLQLTDRSESSAYSYDLKVKRFRSLRTGGLVMLAGGIAISVAGAALIAKAGTASYQVTYSNGQSSESGDPVGGLGGVLVSVGLPVAIGGSVIALIGASKARAYGDQREKIARSLMIEIGPAMIAWRYSL